MFARWQHLLAFVLLLHASNTSCAQASTVDSYLLEVSFGASHLLANTSLRLQAQLTKHDQLAHADDLRWQLLVVGQSLDLFGFLTQPSKQQQFAAGDVYTVVWNNATFPQAGQYLLAFEGIGGPGNGSAGQAQGANTLLGVAGKPNTIMTPVGEDRIGDTDITVSSIPPPMQQSIVHLSPLILSNEESLQQPPAASELYRVALDGPTHCAPGQPLQYTWTITNATNGDGITDLTSDAASPIQLVVVSSDLDFIEHSAGGVVFRQKGTHNSDSDSSKQVSDSLVGESTAAGNHTSATNSSKTGSRKLQQRQHSARSLLQPSGFGPSIQTKVILPYEDIYLLLGMVKRGSDVIYMPFYVDCRPSHIHVEAGNSTKAAASPVHRSAAVSRGGSVLLTLRALLSFAAVATFSVLL